jgi:transcriptional regulator with XRE-family HTH domain
MGDPIDLDSSRLDPGLPTHEAIGYVLRANRLAAGYSQADLAAAIGLHKSQLSKLELGQLRLTVRTALAVAAVLAPALHERRADIIAPAATGAA